MVSFDFKIHLLPGTLFCISWTAAEAAAAIWFTFGREPPHLGRREEGGRQLGVIMDQWINNELGSRGGEMEQQ